MPLNVELPSESAENEYMSKKKKKNEKIFPL